MAQEREPEESPVDDPKPSRVTDRYWLNAKRNVGSYPPHSERGGKWLIFVSPAQVDEVWAKIKAATEQGLLGSSAKVATAIPNPNVTNAYKVICVYTYDWADDEDVRRVRQRLRDLGITAKIPYKADADTMAGRDTTSTGGPCGRYCTGAVSSVGTDVGRPHRTRGNRGGSSARPSSWPPVTPRPRMCRSVRPPTDFVSWRIPWPGAAGP
jgi:hypothetical protein